jgi:hypothetical protein
LCDLVELCHVTFKLLDANDKNCRLEEQNSDKKQQRGNVDKMKAMAAEFDVKSYFCRKIVSNQLVSMYIHLLGQYKINAIQINHHVLAMFLRLSRTEIAAPEAHTADMPINPLGIRRVTLEPMLYNIQLILVMEQILNDITIRNDKDYDSLVTFCNNLLYKFWQAAQTNPMLYVECLFRQVAPHRFCESFTNMYVSEELRMLAERELLLEERRRYETECMEGAEDEGNDAENQDDDEEELEFTGDAVQPGKAKKPLKKLRKSKSSSSDSEQDDEDSSDDEPSLPQRKDEKPSDSKDNTDNDSDADALNKVEDSSAKEASADSDSDGDNDSDVDKENTNLSKRDRDSSIKDAIDLSEKRQRTTKKPTIEDDSSDEEIDFGADTSAPAAVKSRFVIDDDDEDD